VEDVIELSVVDCVSIVGSSAAGRPDTPERLLVVLGVAVCGRASVGLEADSVDVSERPESPRRLLVVSGAAVWWMSVEDDAANSETPGRLLLMSSAAE
jgi:hypothetical protein